MSNLKFLLDENIPRSVKKFLESKGFQVEYVPKGATDDVVISLAKSKQAVLLTRDSDFANQKSNFISSKRILRYCRIQNPPSQTR